MTEPGGRAEELLSDPCQPLLQANRASSVATAMGRPGFTLGVGPSHEPIVRGVYGVSYDHPGRRTEEYATILARALRGEQADLDGTDWTAHSAGWVAVPPHPVPVPLAALGPRLLRVAGQIADGTIAWLAPPRAIEAHIAPRIQAAAPGAPDRGRTPGRRARRPGRGAVRCRGHVRLLLRRDVQLSAHPVACWSRPHGTTAPVLEQASRCVGAGTRRRRPPALAVMPATSGCTSAGSPSASGKPGQPARTPLRPAS